MRKPMFIKRFNDTREFENEKWEAMSKSNDIVGVACTISIAEFDFNAMLEFGYEVTGKYYKPTHDQPAEYPDVRLHPILRIHKDEIDEYNEFAEEEGYICFDRLLTEIELDAINIKMCTENFTIIQNEEVIVTDSDIENEMSYYAQMDLEDDFLYIW